jgi:hypothetical protein
MARHLASCVVVSNRRSRLIVAVLSAVLLLSTAGVALAGCAGELPDKSQTSSTTLGATTSLTEAQDVTSAKQVAATWEEAMQKLVPLLQGTPPFASIQPSVAALKEEYVQKMVALGKQIAALTPDAIQAAYDRTQDILSSTAQTDWFKSYVSLYDVYAAQQDEASQEFAVLLSTFDTLTDYAFFNVLKTNDPDEATRLGIQ